MKDDLSGLNVLVAVAERRSFTAAAAELKLTPSAVSQSVSALEERLGVRLLARTTRSVGLTEAGERFLSRVRPALGEVRAAMSELDRLRGAPRGTLRLNLPRAAYSLLIQPRLDQFLAEYPELELELVIDDGLADIVDGGCDAGIRLGEMLDREMVAVPLTGPERVAVVGSPAYFAARGKPKHPRNLLEHSCINYRRIATRSLYRWEFTETARNKPRDFSIAVSGRVTANDLDVLVRSALSGHGLAYVIESVVAEPLRSGALVRVLEAFCPPFPGFFLYYPNRRHLPAKVEALARYYRVPSGKRRA